MKSKKKDSIIFYHNTMKSIIINKLSLYFFIINSIICFCTYGQKILAQPTALASYTMHFNDDMNLALGIDFDTTMDIMLQKNTPEAKAIMTTSLHAIYSKINTLTNLQLMPSDTLKGDINYSRMGYPLSGFKKIKKTAIADQYIKIMISIGGAKSQSETTTNLRGRSLPVDQVTEIVELYPEIVITLKFADAKGKKTRKIKGKYRHDKKIWITSEKIRVPSTEITTDQEADAIPYYKFLDKAIDALIIQLPKK